MATTGSAADELGSAVAATLDRLFADLAPLRAGVEALLAGDARVRAADLAALETVIVGVLDGADQLAVGAGFVAAPGALEGHDRWLEWWTVVDGPARRLPSDTGSFDYTRQPWFTVPAQAGRRHVTGPYVDYFCTDDYTLTLSVPVLVADRFVGVVGSDVFVAGVERLVLPRLRAIGPDAALVNARGRVVVSGALSCPTGSILRDPEVATWCGDHPLGVVVA